MGGSLTEKGHQLNERDFFKERFTEEELRGLLGDTPPSEIFSWRSPSVKKMSLNKDELGDDDLIRLMVEEPRLIRRPLIRIYGRLIVGTDRQKMSELMT